MNPTFLIVGLVTALAVATSLEATENGQLSCVGVDSADCAACCRAACEDSRQECEAVSDSSRSGA
jgi:hypothetical protein